MSKKAVFLGVSLMIAGTTALLAFNINNLANPVFAAETLTAINISSSVVTGLGLITTVAACMFYDDFMR